MEVVSRTDSISNSAISFQSLKRTIQRIRKNSYQPNNFIDSLENLFLNESLTIIKVDQERFENILKFDSGNKSFNIRILIFSTNKNLTYLEKCEEIFNDGTFKVVTKLFHQLFTIHGFICAKLQPLIYVLLPARDTNIYNNLFI